MSTRSALKFLFVALLLTMPASLFAQEASDLLGRWNLTVHGEDGPYPSWLEVKKSGNSTLVGSFVGRFGSARPVSEVHFENGMFRFSIPPQWENQEDDLTFAGRLQDGRLVGRTKSATGKDLRWGGVRSPALKREMPTQWGESIALFNGRDMDNWGVEFEDRPNGWVVRDGLLINENPGNNLITNDRFMDFKLTAEFRYPEGSNGGIYLRGRYELQIEDNYGNEPESHEIGGVYGHLTPSVNAARPAGEWQRYEVTLVGRVITIILNDERVIDRQTIPGMTGGALDNNEAEPGPIMLQGDHGPVEFRKLEIRLPRK